MRKMTDEQRARFAAALIQVGGELQDFGNRLAENPNPDWIHSWLALECQGHISNELGITTADPKGVFGDSK